MRKHNAVMPKGYMPTRPSFSSKDNATFCGHGLMGRLFCSDINPLGAQIMIIMGRLFCSDINPLGAQTMIKGCSLFGLGYKNCYGMRGDLFLPKAFCMGYHYFFMRNDTHDKHLTSNVAQIEYSE